MSEARTRVASYRIEASLDAHTKRLTGTTVLDWTNTSVRPVDQLMLHLYMNAFSSFDSTFMRESHSVSEGFTEWGWTRLKSVRLDAEEIPWKFLAPDDGNTKDQTVAALSLPRPVPPGDSVGLRMEFETKLPRCISRTGYVGDFMMIAQWYPKIGVLLADGSWACRQFHRDSEFFADFGDYDVTLKLPVGYTVVGSGVQVQKSAHDTTQVVRFKAARVTDVALAAQPGAQVRRSLWRSPSGKPLRLNLLVQPDHLRYADRHRAAMETALSLLEDWCGPFPLEELTLVDPPWNGMEAGGMEYPGMFATMTPLIEPGDCFSTIEDTTIHETVHQYVPLLVATNEADEPWLDEGLASYLTGRFLDEAYGASRYDLKLARLPLSWFVPVPKLYSWQAAKLSWLADPEGDSATRRSWEYTSEDSYYTQVYSRSHLVLQGLENNIGTARMKSIFRRFCSRFAHAHATAADFYAVVEEVAGPRAREYLASFLESSAAPDYAVRSLDAIDLGDSNAADAGSAGRTGGRVVVERRSPNAYPVDVCVRFEDGRLDRFSWNAEHPSAEFQYWRPVADAEVDPDARVLLDTNGINDSKMNRPDTRVAWKWSGLLAGLVQLLIAF
ncbi:MAG: M1 family metallopeptidase [Acidobacteriota bacterium]